MPRNNGNIIKLYTSQNKQDRWTTTKNELHSFSSSESSEEDTHAAKIIEQFVDNDTHIVADNSALTKVFSCDDYDVMVIKDNDGNYWYKGKDLALILEYKNTNAALIKNVNKKYKKSYADLGIISNDPLLKIDSQTIFIDDSGLFQLVSRSKKPEAVELWRKITKEILPTLFRTGHYEMPMTSNDADRLTKSFYDDNMLSHYMGNPCVYLAYVGKHYVKINGIEKLVDVIKYGNTTEISRRDLEEHRKYYSTFNIIGIWKTLAHLAVEKKIEKNFKSLDMIVKLKIKGKGRKTEDTKDEHIVFTQRHGIDYCLNMITDVVNCTFHPQEETYKRKIEDLEHTIELLTTKNTHLVEINDRLKDHVNDLRDLSCIKKS